ncbi:MAG: TolC family protein [Candidatus Sericytochromatia bacterium]|nr:TolC family protein [Candidatus Sericytochromatia bacterium]
MSSRPRRRTLLAGLLLKSCVLGSLFGGLNLTALAAQALAPENTTLSLSQALADMHQNHPSLKACQQELKALENQAQSAGLLENPQIEALGEDFLGNAASSGQNYMQFTLSASQKLPLGGRLNQQQAVFKQQWQTQKSQCDLRKRHLDQELSRHFLAVLNGQESLALAQALLARAQTLLKQTERLIEAGKLTQLERTFPATEVARLEIESEQKQLLLQLSRQTLSSYWQAQPVSERVLTPLFVKAPQVENTLALIAAHPQSQELQMRILLAQQEKELALARFWPDLSLGSGLRWHPQSQELGLNLSLGVPLQIFSSPGLAVELAQIRLEQATLEKQALESQLKRELNQLLAKIEQAQQREKRYRQELLPLAEAHLENLNRLLEMGKITALQVLQAQQQWLHLQTETLRARQDLSELYLSLAFWNPAFLN